MTTVMMMDMSMTMRMASPAQVLLMQGMTMEPAGMSIGRRIDDASSSRRF